MSMLRSGALSGVCKFFIKNYVLRHVYHFHPIICHSLIPDYINNNSLFSDFNVDPNFYYKYNLSR
jgi:hypothetical protein